MAKNFEQSGNLGQDLREGQKQASKEAENVIATQKSWVQKTAEGDYGHVRDQFDAVYRAKNEELTRELQRLKNKLSNEQILGIQDAILSSLQSRARLSMEITQKRGQSTDLYAKTAQGLPFMQNANIPSLVLQHLETHYSEVADFYKKSAEKRALSLAPDYFGTIERVEKNELTAADWKVIANLTKVLGQAAPPWIENATAMSVISILSPEQRTTLVSKMLEEPGYQETLKILLESNYLTITQVSETMEAKIKNSKESRKIKEWEGFLTFVQSKDLANAQQQMEAIKRETFEKRARGGQIGSSNDTRKALTYKGVLGIFGTVMGAAGVCANVMMSFDPKKLDKFPGQLMNNRALHICLGVTALGMELRGGKNRPSALLAKGITKVDQIMTGEDPLRDQERALEMEAFDQDILRYPKASRLYAEFAEPINAAYVKKVRETHSQNVLLTMEEMGFNWETIEKDFAPMSKKETENLFSKWVIKMGREGSPDWKSVDSQEHYFKEEVRRKYGLPAQESIPKEIAKKYQKQTQIN